MYVSVKLTDLINYILTTHTRKRPGVKEKYKKGKSLFIKGLVKIMHISSDIEELVSYGINKGLIEERDKYYIVNRYLKMLKLDEFNGNFDNITGEYSQRNLEDILKDILDYGVEKGIISDNTVTSRDLFDTELMEVMVSKPSEIIREFNERYKRSPKEASDYFFNLSKNTDYIRTYRVKKDMKWTVNTEYGEMDITINLSKPEKDPKAIAAAKTMQSVSYPKCQLCQENEGYAGRLNHPARGNHRIMPVNIQGEEWGFQYSPYVYYNEHCIVFNKKHIPMKIDENVWGKLFDFVKLFPHYFVGSNADLPIVGGSILTHEHFQGGNYEFAMAKAKMEKAYSIKGYENVECGILHWPLSIIRLRGRYTEEIGKLATHILNSWRGYTDEEAFIFAETDGEPHNTITPIARKKGDMFELDLALRNNITTKEHPLGVYHPHSELHHIKKENIGLIEVMGLAVLPSRLKNELTQVAEAMACGRNVGDIPKLAIHGQWVEELKKKYSCIDRDNAFDIVKEETGRIFVKVLEDAGVYKCNAEGRQAFERFIKLL